MQKRLEAFELWCYRHMLHVSWTDHRTNGWVFDKIMTHIHRILNTIDRCKPEYVGHEVRSNSLGKDLMMGIVYGKGEGDPRLDT